MWKIISTPEQMLHGPGKNLKVTKQEKKKKKKRDMTQIVTLDIWGGFQITFLGA